jgi:Holliday junction resolvase RusA-like endonuclease
MIQIELYGKPFPWRSSRVASKLEKELPTEDWESAKWQIRAQFRDQPLKGPLHLDCTFFCPIPSNTSYIRRRQMLAHMIFPEGGESVQMQRFYEECLQGIVIEDYRSVVDISSRKRFSEKPGVLIRVFSLNNYGSHTETPSYIGKVQVKN